MTESKTELCIGSQITAAGLDSQPGSQTTQSPSRGEGSYRPGVSRLSASRAQSNSRREVVSGGSGGAGLGLGKCRARGNDTLVKTTVTGYFPPEAAPVLNTAIPLAGYNSTASLECMGQTKPLRDSSQKMGVVAYVCSSGTLDYLKTEATQQDSGLHSKTLAPTQCVYTHSRKNYSSKNL